MPRRSASRARVGSRLHSSGEALCFPPLVSFRHVRDPSRRREMESAARGFGTRYTMIYQDTTAGLLTSTAERLVKITIGSSSAGAPRSSPRALRTRPGASSARRSATARSRHAS